MARTKNPLVVLGPDGRPLAGASVHTTIRSSGADASVYAAETGATAGANPAVTDAHGRCNQWPGVKRIGEHHRRRDGSLR